MEISCAFPPVPDTPEHIALAERLGYRRAWVYDTPALQLDVWVTLARAAERTRRIELGPGVLIPSLRHVLVTAAAVATLVELAPGRVNVGIGSGFTGRLAMGQRPNPWAFVEQYVRQLKALLAGEIVEVDGAATQMIHGPGQAPPRPIRVPIVIGTAGPKGEAVARRLGDGIFTVTPVAGFAWATQLTFGTVLAPGESVDSERVLLAAGAGAGVVYHRAYDLPGAPGRPGLADVPGGAAWRAVIEAIPKRERHLHAHRGHLTFPNEIDRKVLTGETIRRYTFTGEAAALRPRMDELATRGVTEIAYQPAGPDIPRELTAFARMAGVSPSSRA
ncbi:MAG: LLM class flavin-dependent oxidoreductase [Candidatus Rokubacteria bacterium]|nr:LLM class flavin-dependent oxidoreductase [Candidatus Rokubacteria bacterium]